MSSVEVIFSHNAPPPAGHYVQATTHGGLVFVSGQLPLKPDGTPEPQAPFELQVKRALTNVLTILAAAKSGPSRVLKVTAFIVGAQNWPEFNRCYAEAFGTARPARCVIPVTELPGGNLVEIEAIAAVDSENIGR